MSQSHYLPARLKFGKECWAYYSIQPPNRAIVFVHGLHGDATGTWMQFPSLLQDEAKCKGRDLFFFGYYSLRRSTASSASSLLDLLEAIAEAPENLDSWPARPKDLGYRRILVVAHSLGAIVSRRCFLMAWEKRREWTSKLELVLYAPAHLGGRPLRLIPKRLKNGIELMFPTLEELLEKSETIQQLQADTAEALKHKGTQFLRALKVLQGKRDNVISRPDAKFCVDPPCDWIDADHIQICKPCVGFPDPLNKLRETL